jgi:hypothetical protein
MIEKFNRIVEFDIIMHWDPAFGVDIRPILNPPYILLLN